MPSSSFLVVCMRSASHHGEHLDAWGFWADTRLRQWLVTKGLCTVFVTTNGLYLGPRVRGICCCRFSWEMLGWCWWQLWLPPWWAWVEMETVTNLPTPISHAVCGTFHICFCSSQCCLWRLHMENIFLLGPLPLLYVCVWHSHLCPQQSAAPLPSWNGLTFE